LSTARVFDEYSERYDSWYDRHLPIALSEYYAVRQAVGSMGWPCLEVGVGSGWFASRLGCLVGVDPSLGMLSLARDKGLEAVMGRGERLPIASGSVSIVLLIVTLCFVDDPLTVFREAFRVLVDGGVLVACIVPRESEWGRYYRMLGAEGHVFYRHARFYSVEEVVDLGRSVGFVAESVTATLSYPPGVNERVEEPVEYSGVEGFACVRFRKGALPNL